MKKIIVIIILSVSYIATICAEKVKIGDLYYELDSYTKTATIIKCQNWPYYGVIDGNLPSSVQYNSQTYTVTDIGDGAFAYCQARELVIPNSVTRIGNVAFSESDIYNITIPNSVTSIGEGAFEYCSRLKSVVIPSSVTIIGNNAFAKIKNIIYNGNAEGFPWGAKNMNGFVEEGFVYSDKTKRHLIAYSGTCKHVIIPYGVASIGEGAFSNFSWLMSVTIPNSVTSIGEGAFSWCWRLAKIEIPNSVTNIKDSTFFGCSSLTSVTIPQSVTHIGKNVFEQCENLVSIYIPRSDISIDKNAFVGIKNIETWGFETGGAEHSNCLREGLVVENKQLFACVKDMKGNITIPDGINSIKDSAFLNCKDLKSITIPISVTSIGKDAFQNCSSLTSIFVPNSVTSIGENAFRNIPNIVYEGNAEGSPWGAKSVNGYLEGWLLFKDNTKTQLVNCLAGATGRIIIPNSVTSIGKEAFADCSDLTNIVIPSSVKSIGEYAFLNCSSLTSISIPNSVTCIGDGAFALCSALTSIEIPNSVTSIGYRVFVGCHSLQSINLPNSVTSIGTGAFFACNGLMNVTIPNNVTSIGESAFQDCPNLTSISIPNSVTSIGDYAFAGCSNLSYIYMGNQVVSVGAMAFHDCIKLTTCILSNSTTFFIDDVFNGCEDIIIYTPKPTISIQGVPSERIRPIGSEQLFFYPFSSFAKSFVEEEINKWQQKGEYERISDWQQRVNEQTRQQKINELLANAERKYIAHWQPQTQLSLQLGKYDADNEVYALHDVQYGDVYLSVPIRDAKSFKENWEDKQFTYSLQIRDDQFKLASVSITMPNGKEYISHASDDVNYNIADIEYNFSPIDLNIASSNGSQGRPNISTRKIKAGISDVDTNIPETEAYNPNTFVVIFANEDYRYVASVPYAKNDGKIFQQYCEKTLGIPADNIHHVENASLNDIRYHLAWLNKVCDAYNGNASLIIYYAGHGIPDEANKTAYILPSDGNSTYVQSAYKLDDFYQKLGAISAKSVTVFMDACFSGSKREEGMLASARGVAIKAKNGLPQGNMVVFSAATGDETAYPNNEEHHGMFTYYLLKKLQETEGDVTLKDLGDYITTNVRQQSIVKNGKSQTPTITPSATLTADWQNWKLK